MLAVCDRVTLSNALTAATRIISLHTPLPILSHVLLRTEKRVMHLAATDLTMGIETSVVAQEYSPGSCCCPANVLHGFVKRLSSETVRLETTDENKLTVSGGKSSLTIQTLPAEDFPNPPEQENAVALLLIDKDLKTAITRTVFAAALEDSTRPVLLGVLWRLEQASLTMVAVDGVRLAALRMPLPDAPRTGALIIPASALREVQKLLAGDQTPLHVLATSRHVFFNINNTKLHSRLLEGTFPDFGAVIPKTFTRFCEVNREQLAKAIQRMLLVAQEKDRPNLVRLKFDEGVLTLSAYTPDLGSGSDELPIIYDGEPLEIGFNGKYLLDVLIALDTREVQIQLQDHERAATIKPPNQTDYTYILMPVHLRNDYPKAGV